ncbi:hypothetical protein BDK51DRAFT_48044 [Blyttiomyces helicus]|uniref:Uncharacterized protein n=1 Tax=Blyttiomyces helicus TaxID=388810 RepID=A0A4P9VWR0_9FUNG|nr:hypothetical protein BDK51DRAFT_48044 [Blyttiomyces helicus]|eukprot:RKO83123.1 hypothetical protein BDK51DRAFT_48044 [Blyttiomyces helicus]
MDLFDTVGLGARGIDCRRATESSVFTRIVSAGGPSGVAYAAGFERCARSGRRGAIGADLLVVLRVERRDRAAGHGAESKEERFPKLEKKGKAVVNTPQINIGDKVEESEKEVRNCPGNEQGRGTEGEEHGKGSNAPRITGDGRPHRCDNNGQFHGRKPVTLCSSHDLGKGPERFEFPLVNLASEVRLGSAHGTPTIRSRVQLLPVSSPA